MDYEFISENCELLNILIKIYKMVGLASDHAAFPLKQFVKKYLEEKGMEYKD